MLAALAGIGLAIGVGAMFSPAGSQQPAIDSYVVERTCHEAIKRRLHDPDSVQWDDARGIDMTWRYRILYRFRAKNAFGAYRRAAYACEIRKDSLVVLDVQDVSSTFSSSE